MSSLVVQRAPYLSAAELLRRLPENAGAYVLAGDGRHALGQRTLAGACPSALTRADGPAEPAMLDTLDRLAGAGGEGAPFPVARHVGFLSYELGAACERFPAAAPREEGVPLFAFARYDAGYVADDGRREALVWGECAAAAERLTSALSREPASTERPPRERPVPTRLDTREARARHAEAVERVRRYIAAGDIYQANVAHRFELPYDGEPRALAAGLFAESAAPFGGLLEVGGIELVGASPERYLVFDLGAHRAETRPIKGTRRRGAGPREDEDAALALARSEKDRAEHVMIVDLERNDLGRVAARGGVRVARLFTLEGFPQVHHLVSTVEARLRPGVRFSELLRATFPGGSITGAPKVRAMEIIAEVEAVPRGPCFGAYGWLDGEGRGDLALAIRTAWLKDGHLRFSVGGGIVADSRPEDEWAELLAKAEGLLGALALRAD